MKTRVLMFLGAITLLIALALVGGQVAMAQEPTTLPAPYESEGGIPYSGEELNLDVAPQEEVEVITAGPASVAGVSLPGGIDRGSVIVLLPAVDQVVRYTITGVLPGSNWHGAYDFGRLVTEADWQALAADRVLAMHVAPNCTAGQGCTTIDVLIIGSGPVVVDQWVVTNGQVITMTVAVTDTVTVPAEEPPTINWTPGEVKEVPVDYVVSGDVELSLSQSGPWVKYYDERTDTGSIIVIQALAWVKAPWGASAAMIDVDVAVAQLKAAGCGSGCAHVDVATWPQK